MLLRVNSIAFTSVLKCHQNGKSIALPIQHITLGISFLSFYIEKESRWIKLYKKSEIIYNQLRKTIARYGLVF